MCDDAMISALRDEYLIKIEEDEHCTFEFIHVINIFRETLVDVLMLFHDLAGKVKGVRVGAIHMPKYGPLSFDLTALDRVEIKVKLSGTKSAINYVSEIFNDIARRLNVYHVNNYESYYGFTHER